MSAQFPNGTVFAVATTLSAPIALANISNSNPAIGTLTGAAPFADDAILVLTSGWTEANERVLRASNVAGSSVTLDGLNTLNSTRFPPGEGGGSVRVASDFVSLSQVTTVEKTGGEQQFYTWQYLEDRSGRQRQRPTFKNAKAITLTLDYDPALTWYNTLVEMDAAKDPVVLRATLPNGVVFYYFVYPSFDGDPSMTINENMDNTATFSLTSDFTRYDPVANPTPVNLTLPAVTGTPQEGETLTTTTGSWQGADSTSIEWMRGSTPISGETGTTLLLTSSDVGQNISSRVTASNTNGNTTANSNSVGPVTSA